MNREMRKYYFLAYNNPGIEEKDYLEFLENIINVDCEMYFEDDVLVYKYKCPIYYFHEFYEGRRYIFVKNEPLAIYRHNNNNDYVYCYNNIMIPADLYEKIIEMDVESDKYIDIFKEYCEYIEKTYKTVIPYKLRFLMRKFQFMRNNEKIEKKIY